MLVDKTKTKALSSEAKHVLQHKGTEAPFSGKYYYHKEQGVYLCAACGNQLFKSEAKFDSGTGWPSFYETVQDGGVSLEIDRSHGMVRTEVKCAKCGGHLGHLFDDGPQPTGLRYCINSVALEFEKQKQ